MFSKAVLVAAIASVVSACSDYPPPLTAQSQNAPNYNAVSRPNTDSTTFPTAGSPYTIQWDATGWGSSVTIYLLRGPGDNIQLQSTLVTDAPNSGAYVWSVDPSLTPDTTHYGLMVRDNDGCTFQWSSQFGINAGSGVVSSPIPSVASSTVSVPVVSPPPRSESIPQPSGSGTPPPPKSGGPYPVGNNCTSTSTVWVNPTGSGSYSAPKASYTAAQSNDGARLGMSMLGAAAAIAAAVMYL